MTSLQHRVIFFSKWSVGLVVAMGVVRIVTALQTQSLCTHGATPHTTESQRRSVSLERYRREFLPPLHHSKARGIIKTECTLWLRAGVGWAFVWNKLSAKQYEGAPHPCHPPDLWLVSTASPLSKKGHHLT